MRIPPGGIAASMASSPHSAIRSAPRPSGKSSTRRASIPHHGGPVQPGRSSSACRPTRHPRLRLVSPRHDHPAPALRVLRHPTRQPSGAHPGRHRPPHRSLAHPTGPQPAHGPRRRAPTLPVPHPRPRQQVHRRLRRGPRRHRHQNRQDAGAGAAGERDRRTLRRHRPPRAARPPPDHQPSTRGSRASRVRHRGNQHRNAHRGVPTITTPPPVRGTTEARHVGNPPKP